MPKAILHTKIDTTLKERLRKEAEKQNRTLANLIETLLREALK